MVKVLGSKKWTFVGIGIVVLLLIGLVAYGAHYFFKVDTTRNQSIFIEGEYSVDGGEWKPIDAEKPINDTFHKIVFKGKMNEASTLLYANMTVSSQNVWYTMKTTQGDTVFELIYRNKEALRQLYLENAADPNDPMLQKDVFDQNYTIGPLQDLSFPDTPGYWTSTIFTTTLNADGMLGEKDFIFEVENPYPFAQQSFSECFHVLYSEANGSYLKFFFEIMPPLLAFLLVCFFGMFLFPVAGFILGKINIKYFAFGALCFFWGMFMIGQRMVPYLNLWIADPAACMIIETVLDYCLIITIMIYLKANLTGRVTRAIANVVTALYITVVIGAIILQFTRVRDLYATSPNVYLCTAAGIVTLTILLFTEIRNNKEAVIILASWTPLTISILLDVINHYAHFADVHFYHFGLAITMIYQMVHLVRDLRKQYLASIRYQQMQKELYEAKVSVMVSQIQPHFMYNALTSIAMMCKIDPDTAQEATVTFAKYLRGNMDSLKRTNPIPFDQELEHLKKYLYIEKLRFGKKLNVAYDIQTTDFVLPQLSIQPLVENAVKHGVGMKKKGGTVTVATRETEKAYEVIVSDDGVGFDVNAPQKEDGRSHVGMENTRRRLKEMCGGEVNIESTIGEGTVATVILPKEGQKNEDTVS